MEDNGLFKPRHPVPAQKRRRIEHIDPNLYAPPILTEPDEVTDGDKFQHVECGAIHVTHDIVGWGRNCTGCNSDSIISQFQTMGLVDSDNPITDRQRYELLKKAIIGFKRDGKQQSATLALRQMFSQKAFKKLINTREYGGDISLVEFAILHGDEAALLILIQAGANVNTSSFLLRTPLHFAVEKRKPWAVSLLLEHGADPAAFHYYQETPAQMAEKLMRKATGEEQRTLVAIYRLFKFNESTFDSELDELEKQDGPTGVNQLHLAARTLNECAVVQLLERGVNPNLPDNSGFTPLMCMFLQSCYEDGSLSLLAFRESLVKRFPNLSHDRIDYYLIIYLKRLLSQNIIRENTPGLFQVNHYADKKIENLSQWLQAVLGMTRRKHITKLLLQRTDLTLRSNAHQSIFYLAVVNIGAAELCLELFEHAARRDPNFLQYCCNTMIHEFLDPETKALKLGFISIWNFLVCCKTISKPEDNLSVLHLAVTVLPETVSTCAFISELIYSRRPYAEARLGMMNNRDELEKTFVLSAHDIDETDSNHESPLFLAIKLKKLAFVQQLAKDGASFTLRDNLDQFPFEVAESLHGSKPALSEFVRKKSREALREILEDDSYDENQAELDRRLVVSESELDEEQIRLAANYKQEEGVHREENQEEYEDEQEEDEMDISSDDENSYQLRP